MKLLVNCKSSFTRSIGKPYYKGDVVLISRNEKSAKVIFAEVGFFLRFVYRCFLEFSKSVFAFEKWYCCFLDFFKSCFGNFRSAVNLQKSILVFFGEFRKISNCVEPVDFGTGVFRKFPKL